MKVQVAVIQTETYHLGDKDKTLAQASRYVREAAEMGAQIICFPETYPGPWRVPLDYSPVEALSQAAAKHDVYIVAGANEPLKEDPSRGHASQVLIGPQGLIGRYNRTIPPGPWLYKGGRFWDLDYKEGDELPVFETPLGKVGVLVCSEVYAPELSRVLALKGAEMVFLPAGISKYELHETWRTLIWARAIENLMYTFTCQNILGIERGLAMICSPEEVLVESEKPGVFVAECDLERIRWLRETKDRYELPLPFKAKPGVLRDWRRPELYRKACPEW